MIHGSEYARQFEEMGETRVREQIALKRFDERRERFARHWLAERERQAVRSNASTDSELARMAADAARDAAEAARDQAEAARDANRIAERANIIATLALIAALIAIAISVVAIFMS
jgi:CHASE3 domain sensor protein